MKNNSTQVFVRHAQLGALVALMMLGSLLMLGAATTSEKNTSTPGSTPVAPVPPAASVTDTANDDDDSPPDGKDHKHSAIIKISGDRDGGDTLLEEVLIPIVAIVATFGTPVLIVFFVCYFKYRRRQENLAIVREYLTKGLPVPPQLLDQSRNGDYLVTKDYAGRPRSDLRKGFNLTFIGLGITLAFYINNPHSTTWAWGLIPLVMGIGHLIAGWVEKRERPPVNEPPTPPSPPGNPL